MGNIMSYDGVDITDKPFGGVSVVSGGDFRNFLSMIRKGCKQDILASSINSSKLWRHCKIRKFVDLMLSIGDGIRSANESGEINVLIPDELLIKDSSDPLGILAPTMNAIEHVNKFLLSLVPRDEKEYINFDLFSDISNRKLRFKVGCPVMLMRNIDQETGLYNWTRLIVDNLWKNFIGPTVITKKNDGEKVIIPRMNLFPSDPKLPFKLTTRQFPLVFCFLYVDVSRVTSKIGLKMLILDEENHVCTEIANAMYCDIFRNI
ncbi:PIF1-like helicase [Medicago truncatula]|uniref:ATP-dependent DNA helicase n=1 Tax=Medicago truncatula TaxID=3880 RepID=G7IGX4_MEDTR|nr:PIF1-like helicase [Medicago truncatula]